MDFEFKIGKWITTNRNNCFEIIGINEDEIALKDVITDDFVIMSKTDHKYEDFDIKIYLVNYFNEILEENDINSSIYPNFMGILNKLIK